jgi:hypothetical protein
VSTTEVKPNIRTAPKAAIALEAEKPDFMLAARLADQEKTRHPFDEGSSQTLIGADLIGGKIAYRNPATACSPYFCGMCLQDRVKAPLDDENHLLQAPTDGLMPCFCRD